MAVEDADDLPADVEVLLAVVADVEVRDARLVEARFRAMVAPNALEQRQGLRVGVRVEEGGERLDCLPRAVLAHERVGQLLHGVGVGGSDRQRVAGGALGRAPVPGLERPREERARLGRAGGHRGGGRGADGRQIEWLVRPGPRRGIAARGSGWVLDQARRSLGLGLGRHGRRREGSGGHGQAARPGHDGQGDGQGEAQAQRNEATARRGRR